MSSEYVIPDLLATWPWKPALNPMLDEVKDEANAWVKSLAFFEGQPAQLKKFHGGKFNLAGALIAPLESKERLRITCDLLNILFVLDECSDVVKNKPEVRKLAKDVMDAFRRRKDSTHPSNDKIATMVQQFLQRTVSVVGEDAPGMERFISGLDACVNSVILEVEDRVAGHLRTVHDYVILRRDTSAVKAVFTFIGLGLDIPNTVWEHPLMISLIENATDLVAIPNDMHSYSLERSRGLDGHNIITVIMQEYHLDLQQALYWLSGYIANIISNFLSNKRALPSWGEEVDQVVGVYIDRVAHCVRGFESWSYESHRYYGADGLGVQECRKSAFLPPDSTFITREQLGLEISVPY